jgi:hypothetical protein
VVFDRSAGDAPDRSIFGLLNLYMPLEDITALVADASSDGAIGRVISAWIFDAQRHANRFQPDAALRLQKGNVVLFVDDAHRRAASAALDDLD